MATKPDDTASRVDRFRRVLKEAAESEKDRPRHQSFAEAVKSAENRSVGHLLLIASRKR